MNNGRLRQRRAQTVVVKVRGSGTDGGQDRIDGQEGFAVCLVGSTRNNLLRAAPLLPTNGPLEGSTHPEKAIIDQQRPNWVPSAQRQATQLFGDVPEAPGARMGGPSALTL
ncbi:unnamed protein product [Ceratitis capitata]|uniref:(Mediterranean fruit fly) hypothetical protein n=1 Tax=Ceratitis capitata TaxID=7213 RepID=A0A811VJ11_CERCA|nr:unnamed protein product [Ceratitis capitata]